MVYFQRYEFHVWIPGKPENQTSSAFQGCSQQFSGLPVPKEKKSQRSASAAHLPWPQSLCLPTNCLAH